jgi:hypothetical protein
LGEAGLGEVVADVHLVVLPPRAIVDVDHAIDVGIEARQRDHRVLRLHHGVREDPHHWIDAGIVLLAIAARITVVVEIRTEPRREIRSGGRQRKGRRQVLLEAGPGERIAAVDRDVESEIVPSGRVDLEHAFELELHRVCRAGAAVVQDLNDVRLCNDDVLGGAVEAKAYRVLEASTERAGLRLAAVRDREPEREERQADSSPRATRGGCTCTGGRR